MMCRIRNGVLFCILLCFSVLMFGQSAIKRKLTITEMFELADSNSKSIKTFEWAQQEAAQGVKVAKNALLPTVDISLSASYLGDGWMADRNFSNGFDAPMPHWGNNFSVLASQVVYSGGAIPGAIKMADIKRQIAELDVVKNRQDIRFLLLGNYLDLYKLGNVEEVYLQNIRLTQQLLEQIRTKQNEGVVLQNDITRYELQLQSLQLALVQIENNKIILNNQLITVLGLPSETIIAPDTCILTADPELSSESIWQQLAIELSPSLKQTKLGVDISKQNERIVKSERLPSVSLFAGDNLDGPIVIEVPPINKNFNYWYVGIGVKYNLASLYKSGRKSVQARLQTKRALEQSALYTDQLQTEIKAAYVRFGESFTVYRTQMKSLDLAVQNYDIVNSRYLNDLAMITDMIDASNSRLNAELQVVNSRINILYNYYKLKKITGNL